MCKKVTGRRKLPGGEDCRAGKATGRRNGDTETATQKQRHRYSDTETAAQKKASQTYRMTGGLRCAVSVL